MKYTATQLATTLGIQTSTVTRHIKKGRLAAAKNDNGEYEIEAQVDFHDGQPLQSIRRKVRVVPLSASQ